MASRAPLLKFRWISDPFYTFQKGVVNPSSYFLGNFFWANLLLRGFKLFCSKIKFNTCRFPVYFRRKKLQQCREVQREEEEEFDMNDFVQFKPINVTELKQYCKQRHANSSFQFEQEFEVGTYTAISFCYFSNCQ